MLFNQHFCFLVYPPQADSSTRKIPSSGNFPWRVKDGPDDENGSEDRNQVAGCSQPTVEKHKHSPFFYTVQEHIIAFNQIIDQ